MDEQPTSGRPSSLRWAPRRLICGEVSTRCSRRYVVLACMDYVTGWWRLSVELHLEAIVGCRAPGYCSKKVGMFMVVAVCNNLDQVGGPRRAPSCGRLPYLVVSR